MGKYPLVLACAEQRRVTGYLHLDSIRRVALLGAAAQDWWGEGEGWQKS